MRKQLSGDFRSTTGSVYPICNGMEKERERLGQGGLLPTLITQFTWMAFLVCHLGEVITILVCPRETPDKVVGFLHFTHGSVPRHLKFLPLVCENYTSSKKY